MGICALYYMREFPPNILLREENDSQRGCLNCLCSRGLPNIALFIACSGGLPDIALFKTRYNIKIKQHRKHKTNTSSPPPSQRPPCGSSSFLLHLGNNLSHCQILPLLLI